MRYLPVILAIITSNIAYSAPPLDCQALLAPNKPSMLSRVWGSIKATGQLITKGPSQPAPPSDPTVLDFEKLPQHERSLYASMDNNQRGGRGIFGGGWETSRPLNEYYREVGFFQPALMSSIESMFYGDRAQSDKASVRMLEVGAGTGQALEDIQTSVEAQRFSLSDHEIELVGVEPNKPNNMSGTWYPGTMSIREGERLRGVSNNPHPKIKIITMHKFFEQISDADLGKFGLIISIRAATYYTPQVSFVINKMLRLRGTVSRMIFDIKNADIVIKGDGTNIPLKDWIFNHLKVGLPRVDMQPSSVHENVTMFLISDMNLEEPSYQLPNLRFDHYHNQNGARIFRE